MDGESDQLMISCLFRCSDKHLVSSIITYKDFFLASPKSNNFITKFRNDLVPMSMLRFFGFGWCEGKWVWAEKSTRKAQWGTLTSGTAGSPARVGGMLLHFLSTCFLWIGGRSTQKNISIPREGNRGMTKASRLARCQHSPLPIVASS